MAGTDSKYYQVSLDGVDSQPVTSGRWFKVGIALTVGITLVGIVAFNPRRPQSTSTSEADSTSLLGLARTPTFRTNFVGGKVQRAGASTVPQAVQSQDFTPQKDLRQIAGLAVRQIALNRQGIQGRDISMRAIETNEDKEIEAVRAQAAALQNATQSMKGEVQKKAKEMSGVTAPLGFFDPLGFTADCSEGKLLFYREVELKHGRVGMLAALGFLVGEQFHPLFGGNIDVPSYIAFQQTPLQSFWPAVLAAIAIPETFSVFTFRSPFGMDIMDTMWTMRSDHQPGNLGFDPLGLAPKDPQEFKEMQTKELNNGRLAMLAAAGMIAQELATGQKLFGR